METQKQDGCLDAWSQQLRVGMVSRVEKGNRIKVFDHVAQAISMISEKHIKHNERKLNGDIPPK